VPRGNAKADGDFPSFLELSPLSSLLLMTSSASHSWTLRIAREEDADAIAELIPLSVRGLQAAHYSKEQMDAAIGPVFGVDRQIIRDGTYFVAEAAGKIVGCGGWSRRKTVYGGDRGRKGEDEGLDPATDPARIRAFFVHPEWARRGIGRAILAECEAALCAAGFRSAVLVGTLAGEPLYAACGYSIDERLDLPLPGVLTLPGVRMTKSFSPPALPPR
jgi:GNAT superfamily N-acetyltransferase